MARRAGELDEERRSYSALFVFAVGLLLAGAVWSVWDDNITRRPWKKYQAEFYSLQVQQAREALQAEENRLAADADYKSLTAELAGAEAELKTSENAKRLQALEAEDTRAGVRVAERDLALRIVKSKMEEAWYEYDHAVLTGHPTDTAKARLEELERERQVTDKDLTESQAKQDQIHKEMDEIRSAVVELTAKRAGLEAERDKLDQRLEGLLVPIGPLRVPRVPKIEQVVLHEFERSNFDTPLSRVDRCTSCHAAILKPGYENEPNPLKTHPDLQLITKVHPTETFGCTPCHEGQGPAVNSPEQAHGEVRHWDRPLMRGEKVQANCIKCHVDTRKLVGGDTIGRGQRLFEELGCHGCHLIEGIETLDKVGPSLRLISAKVDPSWLIRWVSNPHKFRERTRMPNFGFSESQATAVAAYLLDSTKEGSDKWLAEHPAPTGADAGDAALVAQGKQFVDTLGCRACHGFEPGQSPALLGENKDIAPNLSNVAEKTDARWMYNWIKNPRGYSSVARMPSLRLSDTEARAIVSFLQTLGKKSETPDLVAQLGDPQTIAAGKNLVRKYGCFGCHEINGMETESRIGVELSTFGSKTLEELFFGNHTDIPNTWADWTYNKLHEPRTYATERIEQLMPNFELTDTDIRALRVFLASRTDHKIPPQFLASNTLRGQRILAGRRLVERYNCVGCHIVEGQGGAIRARYAEQPTMAPPTLNGEGAKVQADWLYGFVKEPVPLRPWLQVRMPTFGLTDKEATAIAEYFAAQDGIDTPFVHIADAQIPKENVEAGQLLTSADYFACFSCHQRGDKKPEGPPEGWAPDLSMARTRLNPEWILKWLHDPQAVQPGTKMPSFYPGGPDDVFGGNEEQQIRALRDYILTLGNPATMVAQRPRDGGEQAN